MKDKNGEVAHPRWLENQPAGQGYMFDRMRSLLEQFTYVSMHDDGTYVVDVSDGDDIFQKAGELLEELSTQENLRKRDFLDVQCYEAIALMRERGAAVVVFTPSELRGASVSRVEDRMIEFGWECIDSLAAWPHTVNCQHCNIEFESTEADYDDTLAGTALICPNCGGYVVGNPDEQNDEEG